MPYPFHEKNFVYTLTPVCDEPTVKRTPTT